jgi:hypothetical protein
LYGDVVNVQNEETVSSKDTVSLVISNFTSGSRRSDGFPADRWKCWMDPISGYMEGVYIIFRSSGGFVKY